MTAPLAHAPPPTEALESLQAQAVVLLAAGTGVTKTAEQLGIDRRTLYRWRLEPRFTRAVQIEIAAQAALMREALQARAVVLAEKAYNVLESALDVGGYPGLVAARIVLQRVEAPDLVLLPTAAETERQGGAREPPGVAARRLAERKGLRRR